MKYRSKTAGFTLVELLIVMGLMSGLMIILTDVAVSSLDVQNESSATASVTQDGRYMLARLSYDIQRASSVTTPASLGASSPSLVLVVSGVTHTYTLNGTDLQLTNSLGTNNLNSSESTISGFTVQRLGNVGGKDTIKLSFTVTSKGRDDQGQRTQAFTTTVGRR